MHSCEPGDRACENHRRYYQTNFDRPNPYHPKSRGSPENRPKPAVGLRPDPTPIFDHPDLRSEPIEEDGKAIRSDALRPDQPIATLSTNNDPTVTTALPRPLKELSTLTQEQIEKGRMVAAAYEVDHQINQEMQYTGQQNATDNVLLRQSDSILRQTELSGYKVIKNLSDKQYLVLEKGNNVEVVFRGRAGNTHHVRAPQNSLENILAEGDTMVGVDSVHVSETLRGVPRDYTYIDKLMGELQIMRPNADIGVVSYSNGGPRGLYMAEKYGLPHYSIDPLLGPQEVALLGKRGPNSAALDLVRTNRPALASGMGQTAQQILTGDNAHINTINVAPVKAIEPLNPLTAIVDAHDYRHFSMLNQLDDQSYVPIPEEHRAKVGIVGKNALGSVVAGVVPAAVASVLVNKVTPNAPHEAQLAETAAATSALTKVAAPLLGAGSASMASTVLPLYASIQAADKTGQLTEAVLPDDLRGMPREVIKGATSGAVGGGTFAATAAAQSAAATALTATTATTAAVETAGVELGFLGAMEAGLVTATEVTGAAAVAEGGFNPFMDVAFAGAATGAAIGAGVSLIAGLFHH